MGRKPRRRRQRLQGPVQPAGEGSVSRHFAPGVPMGPPGWAPDRGPTPAHPLGLSLIERLKHVTNCILEIPDKPTVVGMAIELQGVIELLERGVSGDRADNDRRDSDGNPLRPVEKRALGFWCDGCNPPVRLNTREQLDRHACAVGEAPIPGPRARFGVREGEPTRPKKVGRSAPKAGGHSIAFRDGEDSLVWPSSAWTHRVAVCTRCGALRRSGPHDDREAAERRCRELLDIVPCVGERGGHEDHD